MTIATAVPKASEWLKPNHYKYTLEGYLNVCASGYAYVFVVKDIRNIQQNIVFFIYTFTIICILEKKERVSWFKCSEHTFQKPNEINRTRRNKSRQSSSFDPETLQNPSVFFFLYIWKLVIKVRIVHFLVGADFCWSVCLL